MSVADQRFLNRLAPLARRLGYPEGEFGALPTALTHKSWANESGAPDPNNERLEFLGDAVLGLVVAAGLMAALPKGAEGDLTQRRAELINEGSLAALAAELGLGELLLLGRGEDRSGGREKPSLLADAYEAVLGAVYLDLGFDAARAAVIEDLGARMSRWGAETTERDPKTVLQELVQSVRQMPPRYQVIDANGPDHAKIFTVEVLVDEQRVGLGSGRSKKAAEREAARDALTRMDELVGLP